MEADNILEKLNTSVLNFLSPLDRDETYKLIVQEAVKLVNGDDGIILLEESGNLKNVYGSSKAASKFQPRDRGFAFSSYSEKKAFVLEAKDFVEVHPRTVADGIHSALFIPLSYKDQAIGVLVVRSTKASHFTKKELGLLRVFGATATLAIRKMQLYDETKRALDTRDMFISIASHELRTPLTSLNGYIQLLHSRMAKSDGPESKWVDALHEECGRLTNLIKELLEVNRIKQGSLQFILRECHISEVIEQAIERSKFTFKDRNVVFQNGIKNKDDMVIGDFDKLLQVFTSLITNALKFSPENKDVVITIKDKKQKLVVQIIDKGIGMGREDVRRVFQGFYKNTENLKEGMGVGLMLAKHIINYHKGTIDVHSVEKKGTTFEITFPKVAYERD